MPARSRRIPALAAVTVAIAVGALGTAAQQASAATSVTCEKITTFSLLGPTVRPPSLLGSMEDCSPYTDGAGPYTFHVDVLVVRPSPVPPSGGIFPVVYADQVITCADARLSGSSVTASGCTYA